MIKQIYTILLLLATAIISCNYSISKYHRPDEGFIKYKVNYQETEDENPIIPLLPVDAELRFKNNNISLISEGYLGLFSTKFVSIFTNNNSDILIKVMNKKLKYELPSDSIPFIYNQLKPTIIIFTDSIKTIAGYKCQMAVLHFKDTTKPINLFYTDKIKLSNPNRNTPYSAIKGVLLEFETEVNNIKTKFTAEKVELQRIDSTEFNIPATYKKTDLKTLQKYVFDFK